MPHWYAAIVRRSREAQFAEELSRAGFEGYIPRETQRRIVKRTPRQWEDREVPVIRGLVFIGGEANLARDAYAWHAVASLPAYRALIGMDGVPRTIHQSEIDRMMDARKGKRDLHVGYRSKVAVGEYARMTVGGFAGLKVLKTRELTGRRAVILAKLLGGDREIEVDDTELEQWAAE